MYLLPLNETDITQVAFGCKQQTKEATYTQKHHKAKHIQHH